MGKFRFTPRAEQDLDAIAVYTSHTWGKQHCAEYLRELESCFLGLTAHPALGQTCDDIRKGYRRFPIGEHYIYYRIASEDIVIAHIRPQRMRPVKKKLGEED